MSIFKRIKVGFKNYWERMEKANKEQFGSGKLGYCSLNKNTG